ncbi:molecular chaperone DnaK [Hyphomonas beringensis]|uniref:RNA polymerase-binding transcription factor DksA n=2 Tax=Hyphomonas beringensis TaxID=1280946 RepID=A0A062U975_9PROT|nr:molecular chaperone DnaK [Hyphomonas beringensis]
MIAVNRWAFYIRPQTELRYEAMSVDLSDDYRPSEDEDFMNEQQLAYFRKLLETWKADILDGAKQTINNLQDESGSLPDIVDRASAESDKALELRTRDRQRKLISKIDAALRRIDDGSYGYCEVTGEPISLRRLEARPTATLSLEAQERHERKERTLRDD